MDPKDIVEGLASGAGQVLPEVYKDALQPSSREVGNVLGRAVRVTLAPVRGVVWTLEQAEDWVVGKVEELLERRRVKPEELTQPGPQVLAGVLRGLQAAGPERDGTLRDMFGNLLASAMHAESASSVHPAFAEVLTQITPDEARILRALALRTSSPLLHHVSVEHVAGPTAIPFETESRVDVMAGECGLSHPELLDAYLDNLRRLGITNDLVEHKIEPEHIGTERPRATPNSDANYLYRTELIGYARAYGFPGTREVADRFLALRTDRDIGTGKRYALILSCLWATAFGSNLLRNCVSPDEFGRLADVSDWEADELPPPGH